MTTPLPHVELGNVASDIGQAGTGFAQGLIQERLRKQQIAMQQALQSAQIGHLQAQTRYQDELGGAIPSEIAQRTAQTANLGEEATTRADDNAPAGPSEYLRLQHYWQKAPPDALTGMNKKQANDYIESEGRYQGMLSRMDMMEARLGGTDDRFNKASILREVHNFQTNPEVRNAIGVGSLYRNMKTLIATGAPVTEPSLLLDLGQALGMPGQPNARAVGTELANLLRGEGLTYSQRVQRFINKLTTEGDQFTLDPESLQSIPEIIQNVVHARMLRYDQLRSDAVGRLQDVLGQQVPESVFGADPYTDIRPEISQFGQAQQPTPVQPQAKPYVSPLRGYRQP